MPVIEAHLLEGYDANAKTRLSEALSDAVSSVIPAHPDLITIMLHEYPPEHYMRGRTQRSGAVARKDPEALVRDFLAAMQARELDRAATFLAPGFAMHFPGTPPMHTLAELIAWSKPRYQSIGKTYDGFDTAMSGGTPVVYARGTLHGVWPDGRPFEGIRFIDRFEIENDLLTRQEVWNDLAETRAAQVST